jgi:hypothetical protein
LVLHCGGKNKGFIIVFRNFGKQKTAVIMSTGAKILPYYTYYTYEDYLHWEGRWELIDGIPYAMTPAGAQTSKDCC